MINNYNYKHYINIGAGISSEKDENNQETIINIDKVHK